MKTEFKNIVFGVGVLFALVLTDAAMAETFANPFLGQNGEWTTLDTGTNQSTDFSARRRSRGGGRGRGVDHCAAIRPTVQAMTGSAAGCYMKLFQKESGCQVHLPQRKGNAGNPAAGYGICTLERSAGLRAGRGPSCSDISTLEGQIKCCRSIMKSFGKRGSYFGPVRRGQVAKCE